MPDTTSPSPPSLPGRGLRILKRWVLRTLLFFVVAYVVLFAYFHTGTVNIARNYMAEHNARVAAIPESDRAWTHYRRAAIELEPLDVNGAGRSFGFARPGQAGWEDSKAYLIRNSPQIDIIRNASKCENLGVTFIPGGDKEIPSTSGEFAMPSAQATDSNPPLMMLGSQHFGKLRHFARLLQVHVRLAAEQGNADEAAEDVVSLMRMARQLRRERGELSHLMSFAVFAVAANSVAEVLANNPDLLTEESLERISNAVSDYAGSSRITIDFDGERDFTDDVIQRYFTDDGNGDGRVNAEGVANLSYAATGTHRPLSLQEHLFGPVTTFNLASRAEFQAQRDQILARAAEECATPGWARKTSPLLDLEKSFDAAPELQTKYAMLSILLPALRKAAGSVDRINQDIDTARALLAIARYRHRHGSYPSTLSSLDPDLLAQAPLDMFDGQPLRYTLREAWPLLYSVGSDRRDDGGSLPPPGMQPERAWQLPPLAEPIDWILFPPIETQDGYITSPGPWPADRRKPADAPDAR